MQAGCYRLKCGSERRSEPLRLFHGHAEAWLILASQTVKQLLLLAIIALCHFTGCGSQTIDPNMQKAEKAVSNGDWDLAIACYTDAIKHDPNNAYTHARCGLAYAMKASYRKSVDDNETAYRECTSAIKLTPNDESVLMLCGQVFGVLRKTDDAISAFSDVIKLSPNDPTAYVQRAGCYDLKRNFNQAMEDCNKAISLDDKNANAYFRRGIIFHVNGDDTKAMQDLHEAIRLDPTNKDFRFI